MVRTMKSVGMDPISDLLRWNRIPSDLHPEKIGLVSEERIGDTVTIITDLRLNIRNKVDIGTREIEAVIIHEITETVEEVTWKTYEDVFLLSRRKAGPAVNTVIGDMVAAQAEKKIDKFVSNR
jgi:hypothetical protein